MEVTILILALMGMAGALGFWFGEQRVMGQVHWLDESEAGDEMRVQADDRVHARIGKRLDRILAKAHVQGQVKNDDVEEMFCIGDRTASRYLHQLVEDGRLVRRGNGRGTFYAPPSLYPLPPTE